MKPCKWLKKSLDAHCRRKKPALRDCIKCLTNTKRAYKRDWEAMNTHLFFVIKKLRMKVKK